MSFRIDAEATHRYNENGRVTSLSRAQQQAFTQAISEALRAREQAGGSGEIDEFEERLVVVEQHDSLWTIADQFDVSHQELIEINESLLNSNPDLIHPGDVLFLPNTSPQEAANTPLNQSGIPEGEQGFVQNLYERGNALEYADDPGTIDFDAEIGEIATDIGAYLEALPPESRQEALQRFYDNDWVDAGPAQMAIEQAAEMANIQLTDSGHTGMESEAAARDIIAEAQAETDPTEALRVLEELYGNASPSVQTALDRTEGARTIADNAASELVEGIKTDDPAEALQELEGVYTNASERLSDALDRSDAAQEIIDGAANWVADPLISSDLDREQPGAPTLESMQRLETLTADLDPEMAARVVDAMMPKLGEAQQHYLDNGYSGVQIGPEGTSSLISVLDRIAGTTSGEEAANRFAEMGLFDMNTVRSSMYEAIGNGEPIPAYALTIASMEGIDPSVLDEILYTVEGTRDHGIADLAEDYSAHLEELSYLISNGSTAMTEEQLETAIQDYIDEKGPEWQNRLDELERQLADRGSGLLTQIQQFQNLPDETRADHQERINNLLDDPNAQLAVSMALRDLPELVKGEAGQELIQLFNDLGITGSDNPLASNLVGAYLRENVMIPAGDIDPSDPASLQAARDQLTEALANNPELANLLGISSNQLGEISDAFLDLVPEHTDDFNAERYGIDAVRNLNNALDTFDAQLRDAPFNRLFRASALAIVGSGLANAIEAYGEDPSLRAQLQLAVDSARVGIDSAQFVTSLLTSNESALTNGLKLGGKMVHLLGASLAAVDAMGRLSHGDVVGAGLNVAAAGGVSYAVFGSSSLAGPIGFGVAGVATVGLFIWDGIQNAQHNSRFETETTAAFLRHSGFNEEAASALIDQSGEGYSPVPILMRYGELKGLTPEQTVDWINSIASSEDGLAKLAALRDNLHHTLDEFDGDIARFEATSDNDDERVFSTEERPWFVRSGEGRPESAAQLDAVLAVLELDIPVA
ncbi:LysM domain-containing protein [Mesorhizobium sp. J18]|uniref:LysM peptidoglycan-binding domain-containing protein n=1 Tax=Mesorhizobium sp. J18 TaxID=935263 RepID=UPI00119970E2|nr:LysM peptidoglycan-binding domain-containing protein [Mesorhizobium sp. J18]TWH00093.1 LysM domain-containing protein [Mesorhizobium sp. J18]